MPAFVFSSLFLTQRFVFGIINAAGNVLICQAGGSFFTAHTKGRKTTEEMITRKRRENGEPCGDGLHRRETNENGGKDSICCFRMFVVYRKTGTAKDELITKKRENSIGSCLEGQRGTKTEIKKSSSPYPPHTHTHIDAIEH